MHWACEFLQSRRALALSDEQVRVMVGEATPIHPSRLTTLNKPTNQNQVRDEIRAKFDGALSFSSSSSATTSVSYARIARTADSVRRRALAVMLLELEPLPASQVRDIDRKQCPRLVRVRAPPLNNQTPNENTKNNTKQVDLLLELKEYERALARALASGDPDLIYRALLHTEAHKPSQEFFLRLLGKYPAAARLLKVRGRDGGRWWMIGWPAAR